MCTSADGISADGDCENPIRHLSISAMKRKLRKVTSNILKHLSTPRGEPESSPTSASFKAKQGQTSGILSNAQHFAMYSPILAETQHFHVNENTGVLKELEKHTIPGAEFDSSARDPPPRCHPGTRVEIMSNAHEWLHHSDGVLWLYGPAGVGKSAIMQSVAESEADNQSLGATLFFSRPFARDEPSGVWPTISFQLAVKETSYRAYIQEELDNNPKLLKKGMKEQFRKLIAEPFGQKQVIGSSKMLSILIDGLDECRGEDAQVEIIQLVAEFIKEYPTAPLAWIIASRPEQRLKLAFERDPSRNRTKRVYIPVDSDDACRDVEQYLRSEFTEIRARYPFVFSGTLQWPKEADFSALAGASAGLFVYATAIIRFINDPLKGDPISQLELILAIVKKLAPHLRHANPLTALHMLYTQILELIPFDSYSTTKRIVGFLLLERGYGAWTPKSTSFWALCNVLGIQQHVAYGSLHRLHSVLYIPRPETAFSSSIRIFHASFSDFLEDPLASGKFCIREEETFSDLWQCQLRILQQTNLSDYPLPQPSNIVLAWSSHDINNTTHRNQLWMRARITFWEATFRALGHPELQPSELLIEAIGQMNLYKFVDGYELPEAKRLPKLFELFSRHLRAELERAGLLTTIDVRNSSFEWIKQTMVSFKVEYHGFDITREMYTNSLLSPVNELNPGLKLMRRPVSDLLEDLTERAPHIAIAIVVGSEKNGRCAIIMDNTHDGRQTFYFIPFASPIPS
ncbi:hypothetical protein D9756_009783 [Leucocoprinus leucothites]|uniref:NACHT domain-containing protein n=1 Tax=Leucocoprinus leucothites TaxID=201217 RepID=A0A8H5CVN3_9AGAR|nr:hypothetical protein D9756_009783 [Leucoagaricus leucothites]